MSQRSMPKQNFYEKEMAQDQPIPESAHQKNLMTTLYTTQAQTKFVLPESFVLGKNHLLENITESSLDSEDNDSEISFQERLSCCHEKKLLQQIWNYFELKGLLDKKQSPGQESNMKSSESVKDIEERVYDQIKKLYGSNEVQRLKLVIKFIKRNEDLTKIYLIVMRNFPAFLQTALCFLFKHSVIFYLEARQQICTGESQMNECAIKSYIDQKIYKICEQITKDEKMLVFYESIQDTQSKERFKEFISVWIEGFLLAKQGYPCYGFNLVKKLSGVRERVMQNGPQKLKRKKIKKN